MIKDGYMKKGANVRVMQGDAIMYDGKLKVGVGCAGFGGRRRRVVPRSDLFDRRRRSFGSNPR